MKWKYDSEADALYITIIEGTKIAYTETVSETPLITIDCTEDC